MGEDLNIYTNHNFCAEPAYEKLGKDEEKVYKFEPKIDNFYKKVTIYADKEISEGELKFVEASVMEAAYFVANLQKTHFGLSPLYNNIKIFYRPQCFSDEDVGENIVFGTASTAGHIIIKNIYKDCDYKNSELFDPAFGDHIISTLAHEFMHTYFFPRFHSDPATLLEEGLTTYAQRALAEEYGGFYWIPENTKNAWQSKTEMFPDLSHIPLLETDIYEGASIDVQDANGEVHHLEVVDVTDSFFLPGGLMFGYEFDGEDFDMLTAGECYLPWKGDIVHCISREGDDYKLLTFHKDSFIERTSAMYNVTESDIQKNKLKYLDYKFIWSDDGFGGTEVFRLWSGAPLDFSYGFDQTETGPVTAHNYQAAFYLHTALEKLYWETHADDPDFHPSDYYKKLGELHREYRAYFFNDPDYKYLDNKYYNCESNVYKDLCDKLKMPTDKCYDIFATFGLDIDYCDKMDGLNICIPDDDKEAGPAFVNIPHEEEEEEYDSGCSTAPSHPSSFGRQVDKALEVTGEAVIHVLSKSVEGYKMLFEDLF